MSPALRGSLRFRLIVGSTVGILLAMLLAGLFIGNLYRLHTTERFQSELDHHLSELIAMTSVDEQGAPHVTQPLSDPQFNAEGSGLYWQVDSGQGRLVRSVSLGGRRLAAGSLDGQWETGRVGSQMLLQRSARFKIGEQEVVATIGSARELLEEQLRAFWADLALSMTVVGFLLMAGAMALVRFGLAPVRRLGSEVERLRHGEIARLDAQEPAEFAALVKQLNALLDSQAQLITRARTQAGNLAHDLRTPLALIIDEAEKLHRAGLTESGDFLLEGCARMQRQIDYHLRRAAAAGTRGAGTLTSVSPLVAQIVGAMQRLHADRGVVVETDMPPDLRIPCDEGDLAEILSNLIDNAFKWAKRRIVIAAGPDWVTICDDGPGIPPEKREMVTAVGARLDPDTPGTGLGLAATADLLHFYGGELILGSSEAGGLSARVRFRP